MFNLNGKKYGSIADYGVAALMPAQKLVKITSAADLEDGPCRGLWVGTAGTATITQVDDTDAEDFPLLQGYNLVCAKAVDAGTADDIWAIY